jgi:hypothetical protein
MEWSNYKNLEVCRGCIAKIETLEVELKIAPNFEGLKCNFPIVKYSHSLMDIGTLLNNINLCLNFILLYLFLILYYS